MAIDTATKRASVANLVAHGPGIARILPVPDGTIGSDNWAHMSGIYSGIEIGAPSLPTLQLDLSVPDQYDAEAVRYFYEQLKRIQDWATARGM